MRPFLISVFAPKLLCNYYFFFFAAFFFFAGAFFILPSFRVYFVVPSLYIEVHHQIAA